MLRGATLMSGRVADVAIDSTTQKIEIIGVVDPKPLDVIEDCTDMVVFPSAVEPHAHLDKVLLCESGQNIKNPSGDLEGAISAMRNVTLSPRDVYRRAKAAVLEMVGNGTTLIRTHVDVRSGVGISSIYPLIELKNWLRDEQIAELQIACLLGSPIAGVNGREHRRLLSRAIDVGIDVVGGCPYLDEDPRSALEVLMDASFDAGLPMDLHTDETLDQRTLTITDLIEAVDKRGVGSGIAASHCVSLSMQEYEIQTSVAIKLAELGISVIVLPQTNLFLQARNISSAAPRGIAPIKLLGEFGVKVAAGSDNARDPFCSMGRMDMFETASLLVMAAHLRPDQAWYSCSGGGREVLGYPDQGVEVGAQADLVLVDGANFASAIAKGSAKRTVIHKGRITSRTSVEREYF